MDPSSDYEDFLALPDSPPNHGELQARILRRTTLVVRKRRRLRQGMMAAGVAALCLGLFAVWLWPTAEETPVAVLPTPVLPKTLEPASSALAQEWRAVDATHDRAKEFFLAGDRYLLEEQDPAAALRCYSQALDAASEQNLDVSPDDNWLVMALKDARRKEKIDAPNPD